MFTLKKSKYFLSIQKIGVPLCAELKTIGNGHKINNRKEVKELVNYRN